MQQLTNSHGTLNPLLLLKNFSDSSSFNTRQIKEYHDQLLFLKAFPPNKKTEAAANCELEKIASVTKQAKPSLYSGLCGDGIAHTEIICNYSLTLTTWLTEKFTHSVSLHSSGADAETIRNTLQLLCPFAEFEKITQGNMSLAGRIKAITGIIHPTAQLAWLLNIFTNSKLTLLLKEELFRQLKIFIRWKIGSPGWSRTFLHFNTGKTFYQPNIIRRVNLNKIINKKINYPNTLSGTQQKDLNDVIKTSLALLCRETDPVTYSDEGAVQLFNMGRGIDIALLYLQKDKRLSLESYIGYMAFKNGLPVSYGGGWIFGNRCKIGINIYPAFRKGESALLFSNILRLYSQYFKLDYFHVNPYQFGKGNPEGIKSGAFWFYYRLGFKPVEKDIKLLAQTEWNKMLTNKNHRTPVPVLKKFTSCPVALHLNKKPVIPITAPELSSAISNHINKFYNGIRQEAVKQGLKKLKNKVNFHGFNKTTALVCLIADASKSLTINEKKDLVKTLMLKNNKKEADFIFGLQKCKAFWKLLKAIKINE